MTDLFDRVAMQALGSPAALRARPRSRFEPLTGPDAPTDAGGGEAWDGEEASGAAEPVATRPEASHPAPPATPDPGGAAPALAMPRSAPSSPTARALTGAERPHIEGGHVAMAPEERVALEDDFAPPPDARLMSVPAIGTAGEGATRTAGPDLRTPGYPAPPGTGRPAPALPSSAPALERRPSAGPAAAGTTGDGWRSGLQTSPIEPTGPASEAGRSEPHRAGLSDHPDAPNPAPATKRAAQHVGRGVEAPGPAAASPPLPIADTIAAEAPGRDPLGLAARARIEARFAAAPLPTAAKAPLPPAVEVTIGRLEIRAAASPAPPPRAKPLAPHLDLAAYRARRERGQ